MSLKVFLMQYSKVDCVPSLKLRNMVRALSGEALGKQSLGRGY